MKRLLFADSIYIKLHCLCFHHKVVFKFCFPLRSHFHFQINSNGASTREIDVLARSPTGRGVSCPVQETDGVYTATFQPDEAGEWSIAVTHGGEHIQGGPFTCFVFDPNAIKVGYGTQFLTLTLYVRWTYLSKWIYIKYFEVFHSMHFHILDISSITPTKCILFIYYISISFFS